MHISVCKLTIIGSDNGLSPERRQAIIWTNAGILLTGPLGTNFSEILIEIQTFSLKKIRLKMSSSKCCSFRLGLNVLKQPFNNWKFSGPWLGFGQLCDWGYSTWSSSSHYRNQCCNIVHSNPWNKHHWNLKQNSYILIHKNAYANVVLKMAGILSRPQCVNSLSPPHKNALWHWGNLWFQWPSPSQPQEIRENSSIISKINSALQKIKESVMRNSFASASPWYLARWIFGPQFLHFSKNQYKSLQAADQRAAYLLPAFSHLLGGNRWKFRNG